MSDDEPDQSAEDPGAQEPPEPQPEPAYPALELDQFRESDHGERAGWRSLDDA